MIQHLPGFIDELVKIAADGSVDWKEFARKLKAGEFRHEVIQTTADPKLKKYVETYGASLGVKKPEAKIQSRSNPKKKHTIKKLPNGRFSCSCKDWQYKRSVNDTDCAHIETYKKSLGSPQ